MKLPPAHPRANNAVWRRLAGSRMASGGLLGPAQESAISMGRKFDAVTFIRLRISEIY
jgi:hypothetical protein